MTLTVLVYKLTSSNRSPSMSERGVDVSIAMVELTGLASTILVRLRISKIQHFFFFVTIEHQGILAPLQFLERN